MMNISSTTAQSHLFSAQRNNASQIASAKQINSSADSPSSIQILEQFNTQVIGNQRAYKNILDGVSALQVAHSGLSQVSDSLQQLRELGIQAGNGTLNDNDRAAIQGQGDQLLASIKDALSQTKFNDQFLLAGNTDTNLQTGVGPNDQQILPGLDLSTEFENIGLFSLDFSAHNVTNTLNSIDQALNINDRASSELGSVENRLGFSAANLITATLNQSSSRSQIEDTDYAAAVSLLAKQQLSEDVQIALLSQANAQRSDVLNLLK